MVHLNLTLTIREDNEALTKIFEMWKEVRQYLEKVSEEERVCHSLMVNLVIRNLPKETK